MKSYLEFFEYFKQKTQHLTALNEAELVASSEELMSLGFILGEYFQPEVEKLAKLYDIQGIREGEMLEVIKEISYLPSGEILLTLKNNQTIKRKNVDTHKYLMDKNLPPDIHLLFVSYLLNPEKNELFQLINILLR